MRKIGTLLIVLALLVWNVPPASAAEGLVLKNSGSDPRPSLAFYLKAEELVRWIVAHSNYQPMKKHPAYLFVSKRELQYIFFEGSAAGYTGSEITEIKAIYLQGIMFLQDDFDPVLDSDVLVHELVHHLQHVEKRIYPCSGAAEKDAYDLQNRYIRETGVGKESDALMTFFITQCHDEY